MRRANCIVPQTGLVRWVVFHLFCRNAPSGLVFGGLVQSESKVLKRLGGFDEGAAGFVLRPPFLVYEASCKLRRANTNTRGSPM